MSSGVALTTTGEGSSSSAAAARGPELVDPGLVARAQEGDPEAITALAEQVRPAAQRFASRFLNDPVKGEDVAQAALLKAFMRLGDVRSPQAFPAWLMRIVRNECLNELGRQKHAQLPMSLLAEEGTQIPAPAGGDDDPEESLLRSQLQDMVRRVAMTLPDHHRQTLIMRALEDRSYEEISVALDVPVSVVRVWYFRARKRFRTSFVTMMTARRGVPAACQEMGEAIAELIEGSLSEAETPQVREHLAACHVCQQTEDELRATAFRAPSRAMLVGLGLLRFGRHLPARMRTGAGHASATAAKVAVAATGGAVLATALPGVGTNPPITVTDGVLPPVSAPAPSGTAASTAAPITPLAVGGGTGVTLAPQTLPALPALPTLSPGGAVSTLLGGIANLLNGAGSGVVHPLPTPGPTPGPVRSALGKVLQPSPSPAPTLP